MQRFSFCIIGFFLLLLQISGCKNAVSMPITDNTPVMKTDAQVDSTNQIKNGDFEEGFGDNGIATGWNDNSDKNAKLQITYFAEKEFPHSGKFAQKLECTPVGKSRFQFIRKGLSIEKGKAYRVSLWMRGQMDDPIQIIIRQRTGGYKAYLSEVVELTGQWKEYAFEEMAPNTDNDVVFMIKLLSPGVLYIDDVSFKQVEGGGNAIKLNPPSIPIPSSLFGMHIHRAHTTTVWPAAPFKTWRLWNAHVAWPDLEPEKGKWDFSILDKYIEFSKIHDVELVMPLAFSPPWASQRPNDVKVGPNKTSYGVSAEPKNMEDWRNYVRTVAEYCKGKIHYYEIWNEPNADFFSGTHEKLVELTKEAYNIIKDVAPSNKMISSSVVKDNLYLASYLKKGANQYIDIVGFHFYVRPEPPESMIPMIPKVKQIMERYNVGHLPLWNTEAGWTIASDTTPGKKETNDIKMVEEDALTEISIQDAGDYIARAYLLQWASGVDVFCYFSWDSGTMGLVEKSGTLKKAAIAYQEIYNWLVGATMTSCGADEDGTWTANLVRDHLIIFKKKAMIVWNPDKEVELENKKGWKLKQSKSLYGETQSLKGLKTIKVTSSPMLLE